jgi:NADPH:quinone reductase
MKAIRVAKHGGPEVLRLEEVQKPTPGAGQVLLKVAAAGVNPVDTYIRSGAYSTAPNLPYTPGFDAAGTIEAVGPEVTGFKTGDRVYTSATLTGAYAEYALSGGKTVFLLPSNVSFEQGAALGVPYATAFRALFHRAKARAGESVLVHGASGGVGTAATQMARAAGLTVFGTSGTKEGRELVLKEGAHYAFDHKTPGYTEELMKLTGGKGVDIILEMLSNVNLGKDLTLLAKFGRVVVIGSRGPVEINPRDAMGRDASILGMTLFNVGEPEIESIHRAIYAGLDNGTLRPIVGKKFPLAKAAEAHVAVLESGAHGKILLIP